MNDPTDLLDGRTYQGVGELSASEHQLEVDLRAEAVAVGNQFGVGTRTD